MLGRWREWLSRLGALPRAPWVRKAFIGIGSFLLLTLITGLPYLPPQSELREGEVSPRDVEAPRTIEFVNIDRTDALRRQAAESVPLVIRRNPSATEQVVEAVARSFETISRVRATPGASEADRAAALRRAVPMPLPDPALLAALTLDRAGLEASRTAARQVVTKLMQEGVTVDNLTGAQERARGLIRSLPLQGRAMTLASAVVVGALRPNQVIDRRATDEERRRVREAVPPVMTRILRGEIVVRRGEVLMPAHLERLMRLGLVESPFSLQRILGMAVISALLLAVTAAYLRQYQPEIWSVDKLLLVWGLGVVLTVALARIMVTRFNPYLIPGAVGTMLIAVLLRARLALYTAAVLSLLVAIVLGGDWRIGLVTYIGATVGVYAIKRLSHRTDLVVAGLWVGAANVASVLAIGLIDQLAWYPEVLTNAALGLANGILVGIIAIGTLPYLEHLFDLVTPIKLLELSNPSHPLLRRLQMEAPGTYHHTIMVANLAEVAAEAIGADSLLVRVGTYYHDIGKIRRPVFFVENQIGVDNPHEKMAPSLSALAISSHVRDGLDLAKEHRLPQPVADFIPQHHGTSLITYFYHQAVQRGDVAEEEAFRYEGPKPQTRETAIVMLADSAEGAVRAMSRPTPDRIDQLVRRIIREKLDDGQLDECNLAFRELDTIAQTFTRLLASMFHPRIEYPDLERDLRGRRRDHVASAR